MEEILIFRRDDGFVKFRGNHRVYDNQIANFIEEYTSSISCLEDFLRHPVRNGLFIDDKSKKVLVMFNEDFVIPQTILNMMQRLGYTEDRYTDNLYFISPKQLKEP